MLKDRRIRRILFGQKADFYELDKDLGLFAATGAEWFAINDRAVEMSMQNIMSKKLKLHRMWSKTMSLNTHIFHIYHIPCEGQTLALLP